MKAFGDYYSLLGVSRDATKEEIQKAYRKLARKYHPDVNKSTDAEEMFKRINEARSVLIDSESRKLYDRYGENWKEAGQRAESHEEWQAKGGGWHGYGGNFSSGRGSDPFAEDIYSDLFSDLFTGGAQNRESSWSPFHDKPGRTVESELSVTLEELVSGARKTISWNSMEQSEGVMRPKEEKVQLRMPKGLKDGSVIRLAGKGEKGKGQADDGDLLLRIKVLPHQRFSLKGYDLCTTVPVSPWEAALGAKVEVNTLDGKISLTIPKGCRNGRKFRVKGKGLPYKRGGAGNLIVFVEVTVPERLSEEEKQLFAELKKKSSFNPRYSKGQRAAAMSMVT